MANLTNLNNKFLVTTGGNVGIGTTSPAQKLDVRGGNIMVGGFGGGTDYGLILTPDDGSGYWNIANVTGGALTFNNSNTIGSSEAMRISGGKVTIGNTASVQPLTVAGNVLFRTTTADSFENRFQFIVGGSGDAGNFYVYDAAETATVRLNGNGDSYLTGGNVGIGTTSPAYKLEVAGTIGTQDRLAIQQTYFGYSSAYKVVQYGETGSTKAISLGYNPVNNTNGGFSGTEILIPNNIRILAPNAADDQFYGVMMFDDDDKLLIGSSNYLIDSNYIMAMDPSTKNVGIGTTSPDEKLDITGGYLKFNGGDYGLKGSASLTYNPVSDHYFQSNGTEKMRIASTGIVYIMGATPSVNNSLQLSYNSTAGSAEISALSTGGNTHFEFYTSSSGTSSEKVRIKSDGNVGIGTTAPSDKLHLRTSSGDTALRIETVTGGDPTIYFNSSAANRSGLIRYQDNGTNMGRIEYVHNGDRIDMQAGSATGTTMSIKNNAVGIGTTTPQFSLEVDGAASALNAHFGQGTDNQSGVFGGISLGYSEANTSYRKVGIVAKALGDGAARQNLHFLVDTVSDAGSAGLADTKMMIDGLTGNVGIGTQSPNQSGFSTDSKVVTVKAPVSGGAAILELIGLGNADNNTVGALNFMSQSGGTALSSIKGLRHTSDTSGKLRFETAGSERMRITETGDVGIGKTNPSTHLDVQGVITAGDSTTDGAIRRQHQTFATMKPGPSSGGSVDIMFVDHTHALDITVVAIIDVSNVATARGYSVSSYGSATTGLTQTQLLGNISALSISYVNTGGSENYVLRVTCTYSGVTAPEICVTATGQSASELRAAT